MTLDEITLSGFGSYKELTKIKIPLGLTGIIGSYESNPLKSIGSGKSTIVSALLYAFFGEGEFDKIEEVMNDQLESREPWFVNTIFSQGNSKFEVERGRAPESYLEFKENGLQRSDPNIAKRTEELKKVIGMDYDMFTASVFFEQDRLSKLVSADPSVRRSYVEKVLGTSLWTDAGKLIGKDKNSLKKLIEITQRLIFDLETTINASLEKLTARTQISKDISEELKIKESLCSQLSLLENIHSNKLKLEELHSKQKDFETKLTDYSSKLEIATNLINLNLKEYASANIEILDAENNVSSKKDHISKLKSQILTIENELDKISNENVRICNDAIKLKTTVEILNSSKQSIQEGTCPTCQQNVSSEFLIEKYKEIDNEILKYSVPLEKLEKEFTKKTSKEDKKKLQLEELKKDVVAQEAILNDFLSKKDILNLKLNKSNSIIETHTPLIQEYEKIVSDSKIDYINNLPLIAELETATQVKYDINIYKELQQKVVDCQNKIDSLNQELGKLVQIEEDLLKLKIVYDENTQLLKVQEYEMSILKILEEEFDRIPSEILTTSVCAIEKETETIIHTFMPEMNVFVKEDISKVNKPLQIYFTVNGRRRNYKRLSGGQRTIANLALRLGFSKVISSSL